MNLKNLPARDDFGELFYVVDQDFRTVAQGWSKADKTGPLDLYDQRNPGYVFYTAGANVSGHAATDAAAMQAAIDQTVDYRNDAVILTPGSYTPAAAVLLDSPTMRLLGPKGHTRRKVVTVTAGIDAALTVSVADVEIGYMTLIPITAKNTIDVSSAAHRGHLHHLFWNAAGIATSTATEMLAAAAADDWQINNCAFYVDEPQGDVLTLTSSVRWVMEDCDFTVGLTAVAWASTVTYLTSALGNIIRRCTWTTAGGATPAVFTKAITGVANVNGQVMVNDCRLNGTAFAADDDIEGTFGTTTDIDLSENYFSGDATTEGGVLVTLA